MAPPSESQETFRDIVRQREAAGKDLLWARHPLSKFVIRRHLGFVRKARCGQAHHQWLLAQRLGSFFDTAGFDDLYGQVVHQAERRDRLTELLAEVSVREPYTESVGWIRCYRGIDTMTAMTVNSELFDFDRFSTARQLMSYLGLTCTQRLESWPRPRASRIVISFDRAVHIR